MSTARDAILSRLRAAAPATPSPPPDIAAHYAGMPADDARVARFVDRARGWRAEVIETDATHWPQALAAVVAAKELRLLLAGAGTALSDGIAAAVPATRRRWYDAPIETLRPLLFDTVDAGITTARGGIVETGSLVLWPDAAEPRTLSLVPPLHIAVLRTSTLHDTLHHAMRAERWADGLPTNALLVTGPSKTADIQRLLVYGAHGPKQLVILLVRDGDPR